MKIDHLKIEHFGCYTGNSFDFSDLSVIYGENRSGKSTLIYGLYYTLFGKHLNSMLNVSDLCQKGEKFGTATLHFSHENTAHQLWRSTLGTIAFSSFSATDGNWNPIPCESFDLLKPYVPVPSDVASLTSFFREGELIYFLRDIPKYNKTLLQQILEMDDIFILQTRFKKAGNIAREKRKDLRQDEAPGALVSMDLNSLQKEVEKLEKELGEVESEIRQFSLSTGKMSDPKLLQVLQRSCDEKKNEIESIHKAKAALPPLAELIQKKEEIEKTLSESSAVYPNPDDLQRQLGRLEQLIQGLKQDIQRLSDLEKQPSCHTCGQLLSSDHLSLLILERRTQHDELEKNRNHLASELLAVQSNIQDQKTCKIALGTIQRQISEIQHWDERLNRVVIQYNQAVTELASAKGVESDPEAEPRNKRLLDLQSRQMNIQKQIFNLKMEMQQKDRQQKDAENLGRKIHAADRHVLLCEIACQAMDRSVAALNHGLIEKVKESLRGWAGYFEYLDQFDIEITPRELSPIIQAKGYTYKLNQMSKSERIFLYLLLKLAIGDALGHLGVFILDDPADGLDLKRQNLLAHLLQEVSHKRQVVVTTNDDRFADMFPQSCRLNL